jgi:ferredoxin
MTWRVRVDTGLCISSGMCVGTAPDRFAFDSGGHSRAVSELIDEDEAVRDAALSCPVEAISLTDAGTGAPVPLDE